jgi:cysteine-rich repeat protein
LYDEAIVRRLVVQKRPAPPIRSAAAALRPRKEPTLLHRPSTSEEMRMDAYRLAAAALAVALVASAAEAGEVARVSVTSAGSQANATSVSAGNRALSADARFVAFQSSASDLVAGDTNGVEDIFVRDRMTGATARVSLAAGGGQPTRASMNPAISFDGRFVVFDNIGALVSGDTNAASDVFLRDLVAGTTARVSVTAGGGQANRGSLAPALSADGHLVAFESGATNIVSGDSNSRKDVFVHDRSAATTVRVSVATGGVQGNGDSSGASLAASAPLVAFESLATNLVAGDTNGAGDVFVRDMVAGVTARVSVASDGTQGNARSGGAIASADGLLVAFESLASNLVPGDSNGTSDIFVHDREKGVTTRISVAGNGAQASGGSFGPALSMDGRYVLFESDAPDLVPGDTNLARDVFLHDRATGVTRRMGRGGVEPLGMSFAGALSPDGRAIIFDSLDSNLVASDTNNARDVFVETPACGDGVDDVDEACDDGNLVSGDGCDANCTPTACGNAVITVGEDCDDGNQVDDDACPNDCILLRCGDGVVRDPETCDDGNLVDGDGCDSNCTPTGCGNTIVTAGEACDDGNLVSGDGCDENCTPTACGNAVATSGEECDDGNALADDGCEADCRLTVCAGGVTIERPVIRIVNLGPPLGEEHIVFSGVLRMDREMLAPVEDGLQVQIEDLGADGARLLALTHATTPIPPGGPGSGCAKGDGWKANRPESLFVYRNRSGEMDAPTCTDGTAQGLDSVELHAHGNRSRPVAFRVMARHTAVRRPVGPLRAMVVLGAGAEAGMAGRCGRHDALECDYDLTRTVLTCK